MKSFAVPWSFAKRSVAMAPGSTLTMRCVAASTAFGSTLVGRVPFAFARPRMILCAHVPHPGRAGPGPRTLRHDVPRSRPTCSPRRAATIRVNPGLGSGSPTRTNTGGPSSSFGIWHAYLDEAKALAARHRLVIRGLHTHIGSGSDPAVWTRVALLVLEIAARLPDVTTVSLGGGFKVARVAGEQTTNLVAVGSIAREAFIDFHRRTGRKLRLEIEPGAYLVANAGAVVATCVDVVDTGPDGYLFAKLDAGMTEVTRPSLYGAQHPIT